MHAIRQHEFGGPEVLRWEAVPLVAPGRGAVRVAVDVAGVHLLDTTLRTGRTGGAPLPPPRLPTTPGREIAGRVEAVGPGVAGEWVGRRVVAHLGPAGGGYAERVVCDAARLHALDDELALTHAVAMIGTGRTALLVLRRAEIGPRDVVLVPSAAGGLGILLVQAALRAGAAVVALAGGAAKVERVRRHAGAWGGGGVASVPPVPASVVAGPSGASPAGAGVAAQRGRGMEAPVLDRRSHRRLAVVDYRTPGWPAMVRRALGDAEPTLLLDGVGGHVGDELSALVRWGGRVLVFGWSGADGPGAGADEAARGVTRGTALGPLGPAQTRALETQALAAAAARELVPLVDDRFALADAAGAHAALEARETVGKVVLRT